MDLLSCIFYIIREQDIIGIVRLWKAYTKILSDRNAHPPFPSPDPVKDSRYADAFLYIFRCASSAPENRLQAGIRKSRRKSVYPWKLKGQASTSENISKIRTGMDIGTSLPVTAASTLPYIFWYQLTLSPREPYLKPFWKPDLEKWPGDRDRIRTRRHTLPNLFNFITPLIINYL